MLGTGDTQERHSLASTHAAWLRGTGHTGPREPGPAVLQRGAQLTPEQGRRDVTDMHTPDGDGTAL